MDLTIVIVNWNTLARLKDCIQSIQDNFGENEADDYEVWVVDNASTDGSVAMVEDGFPWVKLIKNTNNLGFARANNQAINKSSSPFILLLNSDTIVHQNCINLLLEFMRKHPHVGACGSRLLNGDGSLQISCSPLLTPLREFWRLMMLDKFWLKASYSIKDWDLKFPHQVDVLKGACLLLRREALDEIGLLDEQFFMYTEEVDLCYRLAKAKWEIWYVPQAIVTHFGEESSRQMADKMYLELYRSKVAFYRKSGGNRRARLFKVLVVIAYLPRVLFRPDIKIYRRLLVELPGM